MPSSGRSSLDKQAPPRHANGGGAAHDGEVGDAEGSPSSSCGNPEVRLAPRAPTFHRFPFPFFPAVLPLELWDGAFPVGLPTSLFILLLHKKLLESRRPSPAATPRSVRFAPATPSSIFFLSLSLAVFLLVISRRGPEGAFPVRPPYLPFYFALKKRTVGWTGRSSSCGDPEGWSARPLFLSFFLAVSPWEVGTLGGIKGPSYRCLYDAWPSCAYICVYLRDSTPLSSPFSPSPGGAGARGALRQLQHDEPVGLDDAAARAGGHDRGALWGGAGRPFSRQGGPS